MYLTLYASCIILQYVYEATRRTKFLRLDYSHTTARRMVPACTKCYVQLIKVAPDDGLIQSETCRASNGK